MLLGQQHVHGRGLPVGRSEVRFPSGTAAKCELCRTTQWLGPPTLRGSRRRTSTIQFNTCWLSRWEVGPLMPRYRASCALRRCASMMEASST